MVAAAAASAAALPAPVGGLFDTVPTTDEAILANWNEFLKANDVLESFEEDNDSPVPVRRRLGETGVLEQLVLGKRDWFADEATPPAAAVIFLRCLQHWPVASRGSLFMVIAHVIRHIEDTTGVAFALPVVSSLSLFQHLIAAFNGGTSTAEVAETRVKALQAAQLILEGVKTDGIYIEDQMNDLKRLVNAAVRVPSLTLPIRAATAGFIRSLADVAVVLQSDGAAGPLIDDVVSTCIAAAGDIHRRSPLTRHETLPVTVAVINSLARVEAARIRLLELQGDIAGHHPTHTTLDDELLRAVRFLDSVAHSLDH